MPENVSLPCCPVALANLSLHFSLSVLAVTPCLLPWSLIPPSFILLSVHVLCDDAYTLSAWTILPPQIWSESSTVMMTLPGCLVEMIGSIWIDLKVFLIIFDVPHVQAQIISDPHQGWPGTYGPALELLVISDWWNQLHLFKTLFKTLLFHVFVVFIVYFRCMIFLFTFFPLCYIKR